jgi:hypothetical protein
MALKTANNQSMTAITALPSGVSAKSMILLATETASSSATISFTSNIDDTYDQYVFKFIDIHPSAQSSFTVGFRDGSTAYDATKTTTCFNAQHKEDDSSTNLGYEGGVDIAQGTGFLSLDQQGVGTDNDTSLSGEMFLYAPSSTTFVKHFMSKTNHSHANIWSMNTFVAGYCNVTAAIDAVQFKMSSGNIDAGTIKLYGIA